MASPEVSHSGGNQAWRVNFSEKVVALSLDTYFWPEHWPQREDRKHLGHSRTSGSPTCVFIREALDILLLKLKEKKTPRKSFSSLITFRAAPPGGLISRLGAESSLDRMARALCCSCVWYECWCDF